ncbi:TPA: molybdopterin-guanine dinucleotide biosynthesis protein MobB [Haemophilus influenzae]|uniref:Molybdopterin-guanine dinucleotide biosynthesis protein B n=1 Tax=Haemophilus influenzae R3021 TaxID=375432 RepID=A4N394_HAEIF|nr:molybdopterin-guanine dinucleotide biosynthesis protein MobB [Haemophilus influenzae]EDJ91432.1 molybdopterin-guanine dinucleotide biosynthesis protein B [Haemophilus influenzae R3021]MCK8955435.1 molybdopterin-guanine dinucleotide biosynthesis protein MobB [Haemophilus influenzae]MCK9672757.1 molybdopterin-guanine dinucleotide biosynthesis protein MobB [Haemophilus influenzae]UEB29953.1 molybdopterin-guanine dinucleotide biosynthesis protein MobB [Haemophilus influenzae]SQG87889.1 molybdop
MNNQIPLLGITGYSGSGKTTLLEKLIPELIARHIRVSVIKHSHHNMQVDKEGKDSWRMKEVGSSQVILANDERWAIMTETPKPVSLDYLAQQFDRTLTDLVLVEGFKQEPISKILLHRQEMTKPLPEIDEYVVAVATNYPLEIDRTLLDINCIPQIADFIENWLHHFHGAR